MDNVTVSHIQGSVDYLNKVTHSPTERFNKEGAHNAGHFYYEKSYTNTYCLNRLSNTDGGEKTVLRALGRRSFYNQLRAYIDGWCDCLHSAGANDAQK